LPTLTAGQCGKIRNLGASYAWEQAQRIGTRDKFELAMEACRRNHPDVDVVVIEPAREESRMFFQNPMSGAVRNLTMQMGYYITLGKFFRDYDSLRPIMERHGIGVTNQHLSDLPPATLTDD
ncbi:MAG: hypothetical protein P8X63_15480, partial [Desulfuromonadaceae bacterium]